MQLTHSTLTLLSIVAIVRSAPGWHDWHDWQGQGHGQGKGQGKPTATVDFGSVVGVATSVPESPVQVYKFLGVPYAAPPERFSPPQPAPPQSTPYDASYYRAACIQQFNYPEASRERVIEWFNTPPPPGGESEDCLNLNIYVPATKGKKAVMFWMHGGSLEFGSGCIGSYDGSQLAATQDVIVVTINYRTNVFGFPGSPQLELSEQNPGFLDQHFALSWVSNNIASFSGDPSRILIFGESAGSGSVDALITSYQASEEPPFHAAIMQSGQYSIRRDPPDYTASWYTLADAVGCSNTTEPDTLACMRAVPATTLKDMEERLALSYPLVPNDVTYVGNAAEPNRRAGNIAQVPILEGSNADEGIIFVLAYNDTRAYLSNVFANNDQLVDAIIAAYPLSEGQTQTQQIGDIFTDYGFQCTGATVANDTKTGGIHSWRYFYNASFPNDVLFPGSGVFHSSEIVSVFGTYPREGATEQQIALSNQMQSIWAGFAKDPYAGPGWGEVPAVGVLHNSGVQEQTYWDVDGGFCALYKPYYDAIGD